MSLENKLHGVRFKPNSKILSYTTALFGLLNLVGCPGGGGDDPVSPIPPVVTNRSPVINTNLKTSAKERDNYFDKVTASDPDGDSLTYSLSKGPIGMTINSNDGSISWVNAQEGSFNVEVQVSDGKGGGATQSANLVVNNAYDNISGRVTDLLNGANVNGSDVILGHKDPNSGNFVADSTTRTDSNGEYAFLGIPTSLDHLIEIKNNPNFYNRFAGGFTSSGDISNLNLDQIPTRFNLSFFDEIARNPNQSGEMQRWLQVPQVYINTSPALGSGVQPTQTEIDIIESIIKNDVPRFNHGFTGNNIVITKGTNPPASHTLGYIIFRWRDDMGSGILGAHGETLNGNEIISANSSVITGMIGSQRIYVNRQEILQTFGARNDSNLVTSIFNVPQNVDFLTQEDLDSGLILYSRPPGNKSINSTPDSNPDTHRIIYNSNTGKWE